MVNLLPFRHIYWLIVLFALYHGGKWLWDYITPKYVEDEEEGEGEEGTKKKEKKEKKEKVKYIKRWVFDAFWM